MGTNKRVIVDISANGYGHLAQLTPILKALVTSEKIEIFIRSTISQKICADFLGFKFFHQPLLIDPNLKMLSPIKADVKEFYSDYKNLFAVNNNIIKEDAKVLEKLDADLLISNISAASLVAADMANLPSVCISSLNWADIFEHYCTHMEGSNNILGSLKRAYNLSECFIQLQPHLESAWLKKKISVPAICSVGKNIKSSIGKYKKGNNLILVTLGGIPGDSEKINVPFIPKTQWLVNSIVKNTHQSDREDIIDYELLNASFIDLLSSSDMVLSKHGYGIVTECARNNVKLMYVTRENWPENQGLKEWASNYITMSEITIDELWSGNYCDKVLQLLKNQLSDCQSFQDDSGIKLATSMLKTYLT